MAIEIKKTGVYIGERNSAYKPGVAYKVKIINIDDMVKVCKLCGCCSLFYDDYEKLSYDWTF